MGAMRASLKNGKVVYNITHASLKQHLSDQSVHLKPVPDVQKVITTGLVLGGIFAMGWKYWHHTVKVRREEWYAVERQRRAVERAQAEQHFASWLAERE